MPLIGCKMQTSEFFKKKSYATSVQSTSDYRVQNVFMAFSLHLRLNPNSTGQPNSKRTAQLSSTKGIKGRTFDFLHSSACLKFCMLRNRIPMMSSKFSCGFLM